MTEKQMTNLAYDAAKRFYELNKPVAFGFRRRYAVVVRKYDLYYNLCIFNENGKLITNIAA